MTDKPGKPKLVGTGVQKGLLRKDLSDAKDKHIAELEAKLAKAVDALENIVPILCEGVEGGCGKLSDSWCSACEGYAALEELKGTN